MDEKHKGTFSMRLNQEEMATLQRLYGKSGHKGTLPSFVKHRVLNEKTISTSMKQILQMEDTLEKGLDYLVKIKELNEHYAHRIDIIDAKFKLQLKKVQTMKP